MMRPAMVGLFVVVVVSSGCGGIEELEVVGEPYAIQGSPEAPTLEPISPGDGDLAPGDSPPAGTTCGDMVCDQDESSVSCPSDCTSSPIQNTCGDNSCQADESCATCPGDCGTCCGNGWCDQGETITCPSDCAVSGTGLPGSISVNNGQVTVTGLSTPKFIPPWTGGDRDFNGHGPVMTMSARIYASGNDIMARVYMKAEETEPDFTSAEGTAVYKIYSHHNPISRILSDAYTGVWYFPEILSTYWTHKDHKLSMSAGELVDYFLCTGDTQGDDAGITTGVKVAFGAIRFEE